MWKLYKPEILIFFLAFGVRLAYAAAIQFFYGSHGFMAYSDSETFLFMANNLLDHGVLSQSAGTPFVLDGLRTPLYINFLAFFLWFKAPLMIIALVQDILAGLAIVMVYRIGRIIFNSPVVGVSAAIILSIEPSSIYWNNLLMSDNLFSFLFLGSIYLLAKKKPYLSASVLGLSALTRPIGIYFSPIFLVMMVMKNNWKKAAVALFLFILVLSPWMARNKNLFGTWELSSAGWLNLYIFEVANFAEKYSIPFSMPKMPSDYPGQSKALFNYDFANTSFYKENTFKIVLSRPWEYFKFHIWSSVRSLNNHGYSYLAEYVIGAKITMNSAVKLFIAWFGWIFWLILYVAIMAALWFLRKDFRAWYLFFLIMIIENAVLLGYAGVGQGGRYNLPVLPISALLGVYAVMVLYKKAIKVAE